MPKRLLSTMDEVRQDYDPTKITDAEKRQEDFKAKYDPQTKVEAIDKKMDFASRESLVREIASMERQFESDLRESRTKDPKVIRQYHYKKMILAHDDELTFSGNQKELAHKELQDIEKLIVPEMATKNEMWPKSDISVKAQALRKHQAFERKFDNPDPAVPTGGLVKRWQELKKRLEPNDPFAQNLDTIRPE